MLNTGEKRFIPAGAGNSPQISPQPIKPPVYPRWRGELADAGRLCPGVCGLSPLARGTRERRQHVIEYLRFIPAGAGNSNRTSRDGPRATVYPRWRGELFVAHTASPSTRGLSPLARGTRVLLSKTLILPRFIPAGAGNSYRPRARPTWSAVYPRWRGELWSSLLVSPLTAGLSPLARGTGFLRDGDGAKWRFIPAGAGNSPL